jgi:hypothetical protein
VTDQNPEIELSEQDEKDLATLLGEADVAYNPVLRVWNEVLSDENINHGERITVPWANAICSRYAEMTYAQMPAFVDRYFQILRDMAAQLREEISSDPDCFKQLTLEEDRDENGKHYRALLLAWQKTILLWETGWDCTHPDAGAHVAALGEVNNFFFSETGLVGHLSAIGFEFTDADREEMAAELQAHAEELQGGVSE